MKIAIAADHGGDDLKEALKSVMEKIGLTYQDFGCDSAESVDYPDYAVPVAKSVVSGEYDRGILICGTGIGMCIAANKVPGVRAALVHDTFSAKATREHNDSNVLCMGARVIGQGLAEEIVRTWLDVAFTGGRHATRIGKIAAIEQGYGKEAGVKGCQTS